MYFSSHTSNCSGRAPVATTSTHTEAVGCNVICPTNNKTFCKHWIWAKQMDLRCLHPLPGSDHRKTIGP